MEPLRIRLKASSRQLILCCVIVLTITSLIVFSHARLVRASSTLPFIPVADSYVNQSYPTRNYGNSTSIRVDGSPLVHAYLRFDVMGIDSNPVTKVTLRIYANSSSSAGFTVNKVNDNSWEETGITYDNAPPPGVQVGASNSFSGNTWVDIDVTPLLNTDGTVSIVLLGINQTAINLAAHENSNFAPQLLVEISEPSTATATETIEAGATATASPVPSSTPTSTATSSPIPSATPSPTATSSPSPSNTPTSTATASPVPSFTSTPTALASPVPSNTPTLTVTASSLPSATPTPTATASEIPSPTQTPTATASPVPSTTPTSTATTSPIPSNTPTMTATASPVPSNTPMPTATASPIPSSTQTPTATTSPVPSSILTFATVADAYVNQSFPTRNYGSRHSLRVDGSPPVNAYLRFDVVGIDSNSVTKVTLMIYASSSSSAGFTVNRVDNNSWEETGITYDNAPPPGVQVGASNGFSKNSWVEIDVTTLLKDDGTVSIALLGINQTAINLAARENSSYTPQLLVQLSEPSEATATWTLEPSATATPTDLPSATFTASPSLSPTPTATASPIPSSTQIPTTTASPFPSSTSTPTATTSPNPSFTPTWTPTPAPTNDPIIFFVGDLVSGTSVSRAQAVVDLIQMLMSQHPGTQMLVASVGDNEQESSPTINDYESYFGTTYGTFVTQGIFMQVRGNHDIQSAGSYTDFDGQVHSSGAAYWDYFGADAHMFDIDGKKLTDYSYDLGNWHIVALDQLNGNVNQHTLDFLTTDLAFHASSTCQMVYWHVPTYSSGAAQGDKPGLIPLNQAEYDAGVDIQLNGHDHDYQRFFPINPDGVQDNEHGITTFVVGIGGQDGSSGSQSSIAQAASAVYLDTFPPGSGHAIGVVQFTLHASSADYILYDANDGSILDQGTVVCH